jgi:hypothetical protein
MLSVLGSRSIMAAEPTADFDAAIKDAVARIQRQREFVETFSARGYDMKAAITLLSCLITNQRRLERRRREVICQMDIVVASAAAEGSSRRDLADGGGFLGA